MEAKVKIVVTNIKEFHELYNELKEVKEKLKETVKKLDNFDFIIDMVDEKVKE